MRSLTLAFALGFAAASLQPAQAAEAPRGEPLAVGERAPTLSVANAAGGQVDLEEFFAEGPTVLVVLRGWPGYPCPFCSRQVAEYLGRAKAFRDAGARVLLVYTGDVERLDTKAAEFLADQSLRSLAPQAKLPEPFTMLIDSGFRLTNAYGLRWDAPQETALPSTFVVRPDGEVVYAKVVKEHGGRAPVGEVLKALTLAAAEAR